MFTRVSNFLYRISTGPAALAGLLVFLLFLIGVLPDQAARLESVTGAAPSPDTSFIYSRGELVQMAEAYGEAGRDAYVHARFTFDMLWPLAYLFFLLTSISWALGRAMPAASRWRALNLAPLAGWLFDMLENLGAAAVMVRYPLPTPVIDSLVPVFTLIKWVCVGGSFLILLPACAAALVVGIRGRG